MYLCGAFRVQRVNYWIVFHLTHMCPHTHTHTDMHTHAHTQTVVGT